jgi:large subunit ribosomal protein L24
MGMYGKAGKFKVEPHGKSHIRKGDNVVVLSGKDKGKQGKVLRVNPSKGTAVVERVNFSKKHTRQNPQQNVQGGILERESAMRIDKLQVICPSCGEASRQGSHRNEEGMSARYCRKCNSELGS